MVCRQKQLIKTTMYKIKLSLIFLVILSFSIKSISQNINFIEPRFTLESTSPEISSFDNNGKHYILYESYNSKAPLRVDLQLDSYNEDGAPINSVMIEKTMDPKEPNYFSGIFPLGGKLILFKRGYDTKTKKTNIYAYELNDDGSKGEAKFIASIQGLSMFKSGEFSVINSPDGKKVLVLSELPHKKKTKEKIVLSVFDNNLEKLSSKEIELPNLSSKHKVNEAFINNDGTVFLLKKIYAKKKIPDLEMVFTFSPELELISNNPHNVGDIGVISSYKTMFNSNGDLIIGGLFYDYKKSGFNVSDPDGSFITIATKDGKLTSGFSRKTYNSSLITNQLMMDGDGNYFIVTEYVNKENKTEGSGTAPIYNTYFTNQNIYIMKYNSNQEFAWRYKIHRDEQKSSNDNAKANRVWATILPDNNIAVFYKDAWANHDGVKRTVVAPPIIYWRGNVIERISNGGHKLSETLIRDQRFGGKSGQYYFIPQTGYMVNGVIRMISFRNTKLVSTIIEL